MRERLQKVLASRGIASRRAAEKLIGSGRVTVNGHVAQLGQRVDSEEDDVRVDDRRIGGDAVGYLYLALNKPAGYVSTARATHGEPTVLDLVKVPKRVFPVGRLDRDTSGLLLLTNDGEWANHIMHPRFGIEKEYHAAVERRPTSETLAVLSAGVALESGAVSAPCTVSILQSGVRRTILRIVLTQGKKRQIRLMGMAVGHPIIELRRVRVDGISVEALAPGAWRELSPQEVEGVRRSGNHSTVESGAPGQTSHRN